MQYGDWIPIERELPNTGGKIALMQVDNGVVMSIMSGIEIPTRTDCFGIPRPTPKQELADMLKAFSHWKPMD